jgi:hypothetical protein
MFIGKKPVKVSKTVVQSAMSLAPLLIDVVAFRRTHLILTKGLSIFLQVNITVDFYQKFLCNNNG